MFGDRCSGTIGSSMRSRRPSHDSAIFCGPVTFRSEKVTLRFSFAASPWEKVSRRREWVRSPRQSSASPDEKVRSPRQRVSSPTRFWASPGHFSGSPTASCASPTAFSGSPFEKVRSPFQKVNGHLASKTPFLAFQSPKTPSSGSFYPVSTCFGRVVSPLTAADRLPHRRRAWSAAPCHPFGASVCWKTRNLKLQTRN